MRRITAWVVAIALAVVTLAAPAAALATEATLTEVVEAVKAVQTEVASDKAETAGVKVQVEAVKAEVHATLPLLEKADELLGGTLKVSCSGCTSGSGGEITFASATQSQVDGDTEAVTNAIWYLIGAIIACVSLLLLYLEIRQ